MLRWTDPDNDDDIAIADLQIEYDDPSAITTTPTAKSTVKGFFTHFQTYYRVR